MAQLSNSHFKDCGVELYADFCVCHSEHIENLARSLKNPIQLITGSEESSSHGPQSTDGSEEGTEAITTSDGHHDTQDSSDSSDGDTSSSTLGSPSTPSTPTSSPTTEAALSKSVATNQPSQGARSKFLALCVNTGGIYKTLSEVDLTGIKSDMAGFLKMKEAYVGTRGLRSRLGFLIKPVTLEFVQVSFVWYRTLQPHFTNILALSSSRSGIESMATSQSATGPRASRHIL